MNAPEKNPGSLRGPQIVEYVTAINDVCVSAAPFLYGCEACAGPPGESLDARNDKETYAYVYVS
eukprot:6092435-Pyramimonas_sp.AAC.1